MSNGRIHADESRGRERVRELLVQIEQRLPFLFRLKPSEKLRLVKPRAGAHAVAADHRRSTDRGRHSAGRR